MSTLWGEAKIALMSVRTLKNPVKRGKDNNIVSCRTINSTHKMGWGVGGGGNLYHKARYRTNMVEQSEIYEIFFIYFLMENHSVYVCVDRERAREREGITKSKHVFHWKLFTPNFRP